MKISDVSMFSLSIFRLDKVLLSFDFYFFFLLLFFTFNYISRFGSFCINKDTGRIVIYVKIDCNFILLRSLRFFLYDFNQDLFLFSFLIFDDVTFLNRML